MRNPIDGLKSAAPTTVDDLIKQRQAINHAVSGQPPAPPTLPQQQPMPAPAPAPQSYGGFTFHQPTPDIEGLVRAMRASGMQGSNTQDIELQPDIDELLRRAAAIPVGQ